MKASLIEIGNSRGIRIPKVLLKELSIDDIVEIEKEGNRLVIKPVKSQPRRGWDRDFSLMHQRKEDAFLLEEGIEEMENLEWK